MKNVLFNGSRIFFYLDGQIGSMNKRHGFKLPASFEGLLGETESTVQFRVLNKKKLHMLKTKELSSLN